jgi:hypothetical protein
MRVPRFRIAWLMVAVAIAAVDSGAIRAMLGIRPDAAILLVFGALPMANVLVVGLLAALFCSDVTHAPNYDVRRNAMTSFYSLEGFGRCSAPHSQFARAVAFKCNAKQSPLRV